VTAETAAAAQSETMLTERLRQWQAIQIPKQPLIDLHQSLNDQSPSKTSDDDDDEYQPSSVGQNRFSSNFLRNHLYKQI
jgi:hypothetical protein